MADRKYRRRAAKAASPCKRRHPRYAIAPSRHLRILHITGSFPPWRTGGIAAHVDYLVRALTDLHDTCGDRACNVRVLTAGDESSDGKARVLTPILLCHPLKGKGGHFLPGGEIPLGDTVKQVLDLWPHLWRESQADIIHVHDFESAFIGMLLKSAFGVRLAMTVHKTPKEWNPTNVRSNVKDCYLETIRNFRLVDVMFAPSEAYRKRLDQQHFGRRVRLVHHGVPIKRLRKTSEYPDVFRRLDLAEVARFVLMPCRLDRHKAPDVLINAAALLGKRARSEGLIFVITGAGSCSTDDDSLNYRNQILALVKQLGVQDIVRVGPSDGQDVPAYEMPTLYRRALACVVPSRRDGFPQAVLESFAFGLPTVAALTGGIEDMIDPEENGLLFNRDEPEDLADKLLQLLDRPDFAGRLGKAGFHTVRRKFSADRMARRHFSCYCEAVYGTRRRPKRKGTALTQRSLGMTRP